MSKRIEIHRSHPTRLRIGAFWFDRGINEVSEESYEVIKENPIFKMQLESGAMRVVEREDPKAEVRIESPLGALNFNEARALIAKTESVSDLESWKQGESRAGILKAIEQRIEKLNEK